MPAKSVAQQHLMGAVHQYQKTGELPKNKSFAAEVKAVADGQKKKKGKGKTKGITKKAAEEFASTKHKGLPQKKESYQNFRPTFKEFLTETQVDQYLDDILHSEEGAALNAAWDDGDERAAEEIFRRVLGDNETLIRMMLHRLFGAEYDRSPPKKKEGRTKQVLRRWLDRKRAGAIG